MAASAVPAPAKSSEQSAQASGAAERRRWYWPVYPFSVVALTLAAAAGVLANLPAVARPRVDVDSGGYGFMDLEIVPEHGWPLQYAEREPIVVKAGILTFIGESSTIWRPWENTRRFYPLALTVDVLVWLAIILAAACLAQFWRSRRRTLWQPRLIDLVATTTIVSLIIGWFATERLATRRERKLVEFADLTRGDPRYPDQYGAAVPLFLPTSWQVRYEEEFGCIRWTTRDAALAREFSRLTLLTIVEPQLDCASDLARMPQLEGLDFSQTSLTYLDATRQFTLLSTLPAMPRLRAVNLYDQPATDADMAWLAKCRRLESINLMNADLGDEGLRLLGTLPHLRRLHLSSNRITDEGCRRLAEFPALEELRLASRRITDPGVRALGTASQLKTLHVTASASQEAFADLQAALPDCNVSPARYRE